MSNTEPEKDAGPACSGICPGVAERDARAQRVDVAVVAAQSPTYCDVQEPTRKYFCASVLTMGGTGQVGFGWLNGLPSLTEEAARQGFHDKFTEALGPRNGKSVMRGFPARALERLRDPDRLHEFGAVTEDFVKT